jgi:hypothetical protein
LRLLWVLVPVWGLIGVLVNRDLRRLLGQRIAEIRRGSAHALRRAADKTRGVVVAGLTLQRRW